jgi:hypothetical protein
MKEEIEKRKEKETNRTQSKEPTYPSHICVTWTFKWKNRIKCHNVALPFTF